MYCFKCGKEIDDESIFCRHCGTEQNRKVEEVVESVQEEKEGTNWFLKGAVIFLLFIFGVSIMSGLIGTYLNANSSSNDSDRLTQSEYEIKKVDFMESCKELPYKDVMRNPDYYSGKYYKVNVQVSTITTGRNPYITAYTYDKEYDSYIGNMIYIFDNRQTSYGDYFKVVEGDIITAYCVFNKLEESQNMINKETSETLALNMVFAKLINE